MGNWFSTITSYIPFYPGQRSVTLEQKIELEPDVIRVTPPEDIDVATSCVQVPESCKKFGGRRNYIPFNIFSAEDVPEEFKNDRLFKYLANVGKRVVRVVVNASQMDVWYGTGVVTKYRGSKVIAVPRSLVQSETMATETTIDFFYDTSDFKGVFTSQGTGIVDFPSNADLTLLTFDPEPEVICKSYIPDLDRFKVEVTVNDEDDNLRKGEAEVFVEEGNYYILTNPTLIDTDFQAENCEIRFCVDNSIEPSSGTGIFYMDENDTIVSFEPVPDIIKRELVKRDALWQNTGDLPVQPILISHPYGAQKAISMGTGFSDIQKEMVARSAIRDVLGPGLEDEKEEREYVKKNLLVHTASTYPGSAGGLVIPVGDDSKIRGGYSKAFVHLRGHKSDLMKLQTSSHNINVSTLLGWI